MAELVAEGAPLQRVVTEVSRRIVGQDAMIERLDELEDWAVSEGYSALGYKICEARGPLSSAAEAMRQYATGELRTAE